MAERYDYNFVENGRNQQKLSVTVLGLLRLDAAARVYVEVYGFEEIDGEPVICAETLIIMSSLPLDDIKCIFNASEDIFPSGIGEETDFSRPFFLIGSHGELIDGANLIRKDESVYYCWWD